MNDNGAAMLRKVPKKDEVEAWAGYGGLALVGAVICALGGVDVRFTIGFAAAGAVSFIAWFLRGKRLADETTRLRQLAIGQKQQAEYAKRQAELREHGSGLVLRAAELCAAVADRAWAADSALNRAEIDFADRAFAPFWDAVEEAANALAYIDEAVQEISEACSRYWDDARQLDAPLPPFVVSTAILPDITGIVERMRGAVHVAQRDFQFATIYEQRKTNELLVTGFGTLAWAIAEMGNRLEKSFAGLGKALGRTR